jgi:thiol-disulfide isomerase/thioredoxin
MVKKIFLSLVLLAILDLHAKSGKVRLKGTIENHTNSSLKLETINSVLISEINIASNGNFDVSFRIEKEGYYSFEYGRNSTFVFLYPKDDLLISFDAKDFQNTLTFDGEGKARNNYLVQKAITDAEATKDLKAFYVADEDMFLSNIQSLKEKHLKLLEEYDTENSFQKLEKQSLEYERLLAIQNFKSSYKFYIGEDIYPSESFYDPIKTVDINDRAEYLSQPYHLYLINSIWSDRIANTENVEEMLGEFRKVKFQELGINLLKGFYSKISTKEPRAKDYLDLIKKITTHQPFIEACEKKYAEISSSKALAKGVQSPDFTYEDTEGNIVSLSDFKGKYVYIDIWATWCVPCIKQIPYLKKLEEELHDKNIVFVSISVDKEEVKPTWKKAVETKGLTGVQLFADKSFESEFMSAYAVNSIPRFILINPEGKIVDPEAPRPSYEKTKILLQNLSGGQ